MALDDYTCDYAGCHAKITFGIFKYSLMVFKRSLCVLHQKKVREEELRKTREGGELHE